jgi:ABC-type antimicrobial peptide transport system permease subunit
MQQSWTSIGAKIYLKLNSGASPVQLEQLLQHAADRSPLTLQLPPDVLQKLGQRKVMDLKLGALRGMYFDTDTGNTPLSGPHGDKQVVYGLAAIGILILILAGTNYVNLATVRTLQRQKEIAMRKVLGASIARVAAQFLAESLVVAMSATLVGLLFARLGLPVFATLMDRNLTGIFTVEALLITVLMGAMVGIVAGAYPAWVALQVRPQRTLAGRGNNESNSGLWSRRLLTVVQFSTAMALTGVTLAIAWQSQFASQHDPGFDTSPLLVVEMPVDLNNPAGKAYREALTRLPGVYGVAAARDPIGRSFIGSNMSLMRVDGEKASSVIRRLSSNFFDVYKLRPVAGRLFDPRIDIEDKSNVAVLNESAVRALGYKKAEEAVGQIVAASIGTSRQDLTIIGVAPDIRQESLRELPQPIIYLSSLRASVLTVGTDGDLSALESRVVTMGHQYFPNEVVDVRPAQSYFSAAYAEDNRLAKLLAYSTLVAVAIASFGIYVLATYSIQRQSKEIVVRKLFGANHADIALLVGREFVMLIAFGALIGLPIGGFTIMRYLAPFVERAPIGVWTLLAALLLSLIVTVLSTSRQTWLALHMNPSVILRD